MSQPIHYVKDSQLFTVVIEDFASLLDRRKHRRTLGFVGGQEWHFRFKQAFRHQMRTLKMGIFYDDDRANVRSLDFTYGFYVPSRHPTLSRFYQSRANVESFFPIGTKENFLVSELLDENNGYVNDDKLKIQIEIRVHVIIDTDGIRRFNFHDPFEGCVALKSEDLSRELYVSKQFISHHSPFFAKKIRCGNSVIWCPINRNRKTFDLFLQLLHGVPLSVRFSTFCDFTRIADIFQVTNLDEFGSFRAFIHLLPSNCAARIMRNVETEDELREFTSKRFNYLGEMSTEMLKAIVKKFFSFVADNDDNDKITVLE